jgi:hypothetical protein
MAKQVQNNNNTMSTTSTSSSVTKSPEPTAAEEITLDDMPLTPSLAPKVESGLRMPTLNRLTSNDWPLTNRIRQSSNGKVRIVRSEDAGKSPTPKAGAARVSSFRTLQEREDLLGHIMQPPLLFRTVSEMSDTGIPPHISPSDGLITSLSQTTIPTMLPPPLQFTLPSIMTTTQPSPSNNVNKRKSVDVIFHRDGRRARFVKGFVQESDHGRRRRRRLDDDALLSSNVKRTLSSSASSSSHAQRAKKRARSNSDVSNASKTSDGLGCSCKRSKCRKKYCLCFSSGIACTPDCRCDDCGNTPEDGLFSGLYSTRGCRCDNSRCRKKYCVCFQDGKFCSPCCKCKNCENQPGDEKTSSSAASSMRKKKKVKKKKKKESRRSGGIRLSGVSLVTPFEV